MNIGGNTMSTTVTTDHALYDLITQLVSACEALYDTCDLIDNHDPYAVEEITLKHVPTALAALNAAVSYLIEHAGQLRHGARRANSPFRGTSRALDLGEEIPLN